MKTSKSPNDVAQLAYITAQRCVPAYRHEFSPKKFTQHQLAACLVLKEFFRTDYRGLAEILKDSSDLKRILELKTIPHFTTFQKAAHAILQKQTIKKLIKEMLSINTPTVLLADAGYDSEESHRFIREKLHMHIIIPPLIGRKTGKLPTGPYRREMATKFDRKTYGQRWQAETVHSMIKRNLGEELSTKSYWSQCREIMLKVFAHNVMVVRWA